MMPIGNAKHAIDRAHRAADSGTDRAADDATDRTRHAIAFIRAFLRAAHDTLGVPDMGNGKHRKRKRRSRKIEPSRRKVRQCRCLRLHPNFLWATKPVAAGTVTPL